jgi:transposase
MSAAGTFEAPLLSGPERPAFLTRVRAGVSADDYHLIEAMCHVLPKIVASIEQARMTMRKLRHLLFGAKTEQTDRMCPPVAPPTLIPLLPKPKRQGHGHIKSTDYTGARWVDVPHPALTPGCLCPLRVQGAVPPQKTKAIVMRIEGSPPIAATGYRMERLRCDTCGEVFTAPVPAAAGQEKYAPSVGVTVAILRSGTGLPHYRLERHQQSLGVPLPASTQWELMGPLRTQAQPIFDALVVLAVNAPVLHHDDTTMRILGLRRPGSATADDLAGSRPTARGSLPRTSWRTSRRIRLPYTLPAGSTPAKIWPQCCANAPRTSRHRSRWAMRCRATCTRRPTRCWRIVWPMADVSSRRWPRVSPGECRDVLEALREVYRFDAEAKERGLSPAPRLVHHQTHRPVGDGPPQGVDAGKI